MAKYSYLDYWKIRAYVVGMNARSAPCYQIWVSEFQQILDLKRHLHKAVGHMKRTCCKFGKHVCGYVVATTGLLEGCLHTVQTFPLLFKPKGSIEC